MPDVIFPKAKQVLPEANAPGQTPLILNMLYTLDSVFVTAVAKSITTGTPPGAPSDGDVYVIPASGTTGDWVGHENEFAIYFSGWTYVAAQPYMVVRVEDEAGVGYEFVSSAWRGLNSGGAVEAGITASTTQTQGQQPLTKRISQVSTVAVANDVVTLDAARAGLEQIVANDGANTLQVFPASGDSIDGGSVDASTTLAAGKRALFVAYDATDHLVILGA